jgi:hypothetical protein
MRNTWAFCGPMAMIKEMLSTMPAVKVGRLKTMKNLLRGGCEWAGVCAKQAFN